MISKAVWMAVTLAVLATGRAGETAAQGHYESLTWTRDGTALTVSWQGDLYILPLDPEEPVSTIAATDGREVFASWSPDGSSIVFAAPGGHGDSDLFVADPDGSRRRSLDTGPGDDSHPAWSPDGTRIAFMKRTDEQWRLWVMSADGSTRRRITDGGGGSDYNPQWSPDGGWLVFESSRHGGDQDEIYVVGADGSNERRLTDTPGNDIYPTWSPDGTRIAFCTIEDGRAFVRLIGPGGGRATGVVEDACMPAWSPSGERLAYVGVARGQPERLWVAAADGTGAVEVQGPQRR